jgi:NADPH:quinone reductase-like Zn-dependent oxidoreductase
VVNTGSDKWIEHVREITAGKGVDLAFDPVAGPSLEQIAQIVR